MADRFRKDKRRNVAARNGSANQQSVKRIRPDAAF